MHAISLHWFRSKQRAVARFVLAAFCLTWLQLAAMPCVMATGAVTSPSNVAAPVAGDMPEDMVMAPGEHCPYCPPAQTGPSADAGDLCAFPHDPQVDSRVAFASTMLAPPPVAVLHLPHETVRFDVAPGPAADAPPLSGTPIAVSFCRFLK